MEPTPKMTLPIQHQVSLHKSLFCGNDSRDDASLTTTSFIPGTSLLWNTVTLPRRLQDSLYHPLYCSTDSQDDASSTTTSFPQIATFWADSQGNTSSTTTIIFPGTAALWHRLPRQRILDYYKPPCINRNILEPTLPRLLQASFHKAIVCGTDYRDDASSTTTSFFPQIVMFWNLSPKWCFLDYYKFLSTTR